MQVIVYVFASHMQMLLINVLQKFPSLRRHNSIDHVVNWPWVNLFSGLWPRAFLAKLSADLCATSRVATNQMPATKIAIGC